MDSCLSKARPPTGFSGTGEGMLSPGGSWGSRQMESFGVGADFYLLICFTSLSKVCFRLALFVQYFCSVSCWGRAKSGGGCGLLSGLVFPPPRPCTSSGTLPFVRSLEILCSGGNIAWD